MNNLGLTLSVEEPDITSVAIRPGVVDTDMQKDVRGHADVMDARDAEKFRTLHETGKTLRPEQPGNVIARLAVGAEQELSGKFLR
jgi:NAD(P)-dependent dehydrogenase (short-subunit alcohol dehydrogenase family)